LWNSTLASGAEVVGRRFGRHSSWAWRRLWSNRPL